MNTFCAVEISEELINRVYDLHKLSDYDVRFSKLLRKTVPITASNLNAVELALCSVVQSCFHKEFVLVEQNKVCPRLRHLSPFTDLYEYNQKHPILSPKSLALVKRLSQKYACRSPQFVNANLLMRHLLDIISSKNRKLDHFCNLYFRAKALYIQIRVLTLKEQKPL